MKRLILLMSRITAVVIFIFAVSGIPQVVHAYETDCENGLVSVEVIPNDEADALLPKNLYLAVNSIEEDYEYNSTKGLSVPDASDIWNLTSDGQYNFTVNTSGSTIYSNYVFLGHGGSVKVHLVENTSTSGKYTFKLYKRGTINTTLYTYKFDHGTTQTIEMDSFSSSDKIYFSIAPNGSTILTNSSYIKKN